MRDYFGNILSVQFWPLVWLRKDNGPVWKRKETGRPLDIVSYLNVKGVLTGGLMIKVLGAFCLSISHQVSGKVIKGNGWESWCVGAVWHSGDRRPVPGVILTALLASLALALRSRSKPIQHPLVQILANLAKRQCDGLTHKDLCCGLPRWC